MPKKPPITNRPRSEVSRSALYAHARKVTAGRPKRCEVCGYTNCVQVAHIKPVRAFPRHAPVSEVNDPKNLAILCPNDHHLLDDWPYE